MLKLMMLNMLLTNSSIFPKRRPLPKVIHRYNKINGEPASLDKYIMYVSMAMSKKAVVTLKITDCL